MFWDLLGLSSGTFGVLFDGLGAILGALGGHSWSSIGACCAPWGRSGIILVGFEAFWVTLGALGEDFGVIFGRFCGIFLRIGQ